MRNKNTITLCQVSLKRDIPIILKNYYSFKKYYKKIQIYIICPSKDLAYFRKKLYYKVFNIISENKITIKYENLVENPKNTLFKILKKIDQELLNDLDKIDTSKVTKRKIGKGTKYKNLIKKFNFNLK